MLFNSFEFLLFLPVVLFVYYMLNKRSQNAWLLLCSYFFYGWWDWRFTSLLMISTVLDFNCARQMHRRPRLSRLFLIVSLCGNLGILCTFKYLHFFTDSAIRVLNIFHLNPDVPTLQVILPIGISFYTFQTIGYTIDVYRGKLKPVSNIFDFALYVAYFPQLVAGPIERATNLIPQLQKKRNVDKNMVAQGLLLILLGYLKKCGIADALAEVVQESFSDPQKWSSSHLLISLYFFAIQIYCDFSGYSDIARGVSKLLGIELMINFNQPYSSKNPVEFWTRWHISLSTWFRDYLYFPLAMHYMRKTTGFLNKYKAHFYAMSLIGLWHGANWTFVIFGMYWGLVIVVYNWINEYVQTHDRVQHTFIMKNIFLGQTLISNGIKMILMFHVVCIGWLLFRSATISQAGIFLREIVSWQGPLFEAKDMIRLVFYGAIIVALDWPQYRKNDHTAVLSLHWVFRGLIYAFAIFIIILGGTTGNVPFIYFQF